jgi:citrate lyase beta subunit
MGCFFLITGGDAATLETAVASGAPSVCLDLEDTVPAAGKDAARALLPRLLAQSRGRCRSAVRLSPLSTRHGLDDLRWLLDAPALPDAVMLAKVDAAADVRLFDQLLTGRAAAVRLHVIIETAAALAEAAAIAGASPRIEALVFGGKDLSTDLGCARAWEPLLYARSRVVHAAALARVAAFDEPYNPRDDLDGLRATAERVKALGFRGKAAVDLRHVAIINAIFGAGHP